MPKNHGDNLLQEYRPCGLLYRAAYRRLAGDCAEAKTVAHPGKKKKMAGALCT